MSEFLNNMFCLLGFHKFILPNRPFIQTKQYWGFFGLSIAQEKICEKCNKMEFRSWI